MTRTHPGFWFLATLTAAVLWLWLPFMALGVIGFLILGVVDVWKERAHG